MSKPPDVVMRRQIERKYCRCDESAFVIDWYKGISDCTQKPVHPRWCYFHLWFTCVIYQAPPKKPRFIRQRILAVTESIAIRQHQPVLCLLKQLLQFIWIPWPQVINIDLMQIQNRNHHLVTWQFCPIEQLINQIWTVYELVYGLSVFCLFNLIIVMIWWRNRNQLCVIHWFNSNLFKNLRWSIPSFIINVYKLELIYRKA